MNSILRIYIPSTLNVTAQHTEILIMTLDLTPNYQSNLHFIIRSIILSGLIVYVNKSREIYYSFDNR